METESSANYYYRYKITNQADLASETLVRRRSKAKHNQADIILFDWTNYSKSPSAQDMQKLGITFESDLNTSHLLSFDQILSLSTSDSFVLEFQNAGPLTRLHIEISDHQQFFDLDSFLQATYPSTSFNIHFAPKTQKQLHSFAQFPTSTEFKKYDQYYWSFKPYKKDQKGSLTTSDIGHFFRKHCEVPITKLFKKGKIKSLEIWNDNIPDHFELEPEAANLQSWHFETPSKNILLSVIIPSFNNLKFLSNVISHLIQQDFKAENFEIIIVEDGGSDGSFETTQLLFDCYKNKINLKFIYWPKNHPVKGNQNFFRAGLARNLGVRFSEADQFVFLDSDMLVPPHFLTTCRQQLADNDVIQFQRYHIQQNISYTNPKYHEINHAKHTYIEEPHYWSQLFSCHDWHKLQAFWKYTCTYALGVHRSHFMSCGRFKKYYVSYGFEDTDLGYELYRLKKKFKFIQLPLLHLTSYDQMQYKNSSFKRTGLLKKTAALFYLQHLDEEIFSVLENYFRFQKPILSAIRDLL